MVNYANGKIYKLVNASDMSDTRAYVGSTTRTLAERMTGHRADFRRRPHDKGVYEWMDQIGVENVSIVLLENYPCASKEELFARERYWQEQTANLNIYRPIASKEEIAEDSRVRARAHYEINKERRKERDHAYYESNKERIMEYQRNYNNANRDKVNAALRARRAAKKSLKAESSTESNNLGAVVEDLGELEIEELSSA